MIPPMTIQLVVIHRLKKQIGKKPPPKIRQLLRLIKVVYGPFAYQNTMRMVKKLIVAALIAPCICMVSRMNGGHFTAPTHPLV